MGFATENLVIAVLSAALAFLSAWFLFHRGLISTRADADRKEAREERDDASRAREAIAGKLTDIEVRLAVMGQTVQPLNAVYQAMLIKDLIHTRTPEMDALLIKLRDGVLTDTHDMARLELLLAERAADMSPEVSQAERDAAEILPKVMMRVAVEHEHLTDGGKLELKVVSVVVTPDN